LLIIAPLKCILVLQYNVSFKIISVIRLRYVNAYCWNKFGERERKNQQ